MINVESFYKQLIENEVEFFAGVPDSLLKDICAYITDNCPSDRHIIAANEGGAVALGAGYHLATKKIPLVYMQNSGIGNAINPLLSLVDREVYAIPMLLLIGWRGEPNVKDEPQHIKQGKVTLTLLDAMDIKYEIIDENSDFKMVIKSAVETAREFSKPTALVVRKNAFESYKLKSVRKDSYSLTREEALKICLEQIPKDAFIVSTTGMLSRELFELRETNNQNHNFDFLTVGSMGHAVQIALGVALSKPEKEVYCLDGDGAALMHLGNYAITGNMSPKNLKIIVFNNGAHDSVGGQSTVALSFSLADTMKALNINTLGESSTENEINEKVEILVNQKQLSMLEIKIKKGARKDLGRPTTTTIENKFSFMSEISK